jgi:hypothetical protein
MIQSDAELIAEAQKNVDTFQGELLYEWTELL